MQERFRIPPLIPDYGDACAEARMCRSRCALFDFSFLACGRVQGPNAAAALTGFTGRRMETLEVGRIAYALRCKPDGCVEADLTVWRLDADSYDVMSGRRQDIGDLQCLSGLTVDDLSAETAVFALQGPTTFSVLERLGDIRSVQALPSFGHCKATLAGIPCRVGRLGYTGEDGVELVVPGRAAPELWDTLSELAPRAGFAAADILRIEAGLALFWNDFVVPVSPAEAGLEMFVEGARDDDAVLRRICFAAESDTAPFLWRPRRPPVRPQRRGEIAVTSACTSPLAQAVLGMGYARQQDLRANIPLVDAECGFHAIRRVALPYYDRRRPGAGGRLLPR